jgi:hypothetical protein
MAKCCLRGLSRLCLMILLMAGTTKAQSKWDVTIGALVIRVDSEAVDRLAATVDSSDTELRALITDPNTDIISRLRLRASDGKNVQLRISDRDSARHGVIIDITPRVLNLEDVILRVAIRVREANQISLLGLSQFDVGRTENIADLRLHEGELNILGSPRDGLVPPGIVNIPALGKVLLGDSGEKDHRDLMIALTSHVVRTTTPNPVR